MKIELTYQNGETEEYEAENEYHAYNIMFFSFFVVNEDLILVDKVACEELDVEFERDEITKINRKLVELENGE